MKHLAIIFLASFAFYFSSNGQNLNENISINMNINMNLDATNQESAPEPTQPAVAPSTVNNKPQPQPEPEVIYVTGYSGKIGCTPPVNSDRFKDMVKTVENQSFSDGKARTTKQIIRSNCITVDQLVIMLEQFSFDDDKLEVAKFSYDHVYDIENYYKVYNVFSFSSSGEKLEEFISGKN